MLKFSKRNRHKAVRSLSFSAYYYTVVFLTFVGLFSSFYLAYSHYRVYTDIAYKSFCAISKAMNCDTVSQSSYSIFLSLPVPVWGIIGYTFFLLLMPLAKSKAAECKRVWTLLLLISSAFTLYSLILAVISTFYIRSYCMVCILTYAVNLLLLFYTHMTRNRFECEDLLEGFRLDFKHLADKRHYCLIVFTLFFISIISAKVVLPSYWQFEVPPLPDSIPTGVTEMGQPWIGAENPKLTITEYTDYQCFQCKKMHFFLRQMVAEHPDKIKLIHRNFPMDHEFNPIVKDPFHVGSGKLALIAIFAERQGKFWQMNDILFKMAREVKQVNIRSLAAEVGIDQDALVNSINDQNVRHRLAYDIMSGLRLKIDGTPAYVINGNIYLAQIPPEIIKTALAD
jgi:protein-disulfide isomerase/uncharacterized membrane protein